MEPEWKTEEAEGLQAAAEDLIFVRKDFLSAEQFKNSPIVAAVFKALRPASTGLILAASLSVAQLAFFKGEWSGFSQIGSFLATINLPAIVLAVALFAFMRKFKMHPIAYIGIAAAIGLIFQM